MNKEMEKLLKEVNDDDLRAMFGSIVIPTITRDMDKVIKEMETYLEYEVPFNIGDIIELTGKRYCVTCVYTDNTIDILVMDETPTKQNIGVYKREIKTVGKCQIIKED